MDSRALLEQIPRLRRYARAMVGDRSAADDLVQDTLERACLHAHRWRAGSDLRAWLFSIMHNLHVDQLRRPEIGTEPMDDDYFNAPTRATQTDHLEIAGLDAALARLSQDQRAVVLLVGLEEMSYAEVALVLDIPLGTVMSRLARGRERLRQILDGQTVSPPLRVVR